eukprot:4141872-Alexandrium_andersonii.AAC.1
MVRKVVCKERTPRYSTTRSPANATTSPTRMSVLECSARSATATLKSPSKMVTSARGRALVLARETSCTRPIRSMTESE